MCMLQIQRDGGIGRWLHGAAGPGGIKLLVSFHRHPVLGILAFILY